MEKLVKLNAVAVPLPIDNLDTDQIMPKQFLRGVDKSGLAHVLQSALLPGWNAPPGLRFQ